MIILSGTIHGNGIPPTEYEKLFSAIEKNILESNTSAVVITNLPTEMHLNEKYIVDVRISSNVTSVTPSANQDYYRNIRVISPKIRVLLYGENFKIASLNPSTQIMGQGDSVNWEWVVTPLLIGNYSLDIIIENYVVLEGSPQPVHRIVTSQLVYVKAKPSSDRSVISSLGLFHTVVIILASFWLKSRRSLRGEIKRKF